MKKRTKDVKPAPSDEVLERLCEEPVMPIERKRDLLAFAMRVRDLTLQGERQAANPLGELISAVERAVERYDASGDHKHGGGPVPGDCLRCALNDFLARTS